MSLGVMSLRTLYAPGGLTRRSRQSLVVIAHLRFPLEGLPGSGHPDPDFMLQDLSAQPAAMQVLHQAEEGSLPRIPGQQPVDQPATALHDLARHLDKGCAKRRKVHPHQLGFLCRVFGGVPG